MSCFQVGDDTITAIFVALELFDKYSRTSMSIYGYGFSLTFDPTEADQSEGWDMLGDILKKQNAASVKARYPDHPDMWDDTPYIFNRSYIHKGSLTVIQALKCIDCYCYQSCETDDWHQSEANVLCGVLRTKLVGLLPDYDESPGWGYDYPADKVAV